MVVPGHFAWLLLGSTGLVAPAYMLCRRKVRPEVSDSGREETLLRERGEPYSGCGGRIMPWDVSKELRRWASGPPGEEGESSEAVEAGGGECSAEEKETPLRKCLVPDRRLPGICLPG